MTMDSVLEKFAHNCIIDEIRHWSSGKLKVRTIDSNVPNAGKCFVLIKYEDESECKIEIEREFFEETWNEACAVLKAVTDIKGDFSPLSDHEILSLQEDRKRYARYRLECIAGEALEQRRKALDKAVELFKAGMYEVFLEQFGVNYTPLPDLMVKRIEIAKKKLKG